MSDNLRIQWPDNKDFAFTVFDDTDWATIENTKPVYSFLKDLGFLTTKTVWPLSNPDKPEREGETCEDSDYLQWNLDLQKQGFEIAYHLNSYNSSKRERVIEGLDFFKEKFGAYPKSMANHLRNTEGMYWGSARLSFAITKFIYNAATRFHNSDIWKGHDPKSEYFWGDICRERIKYVRNFIYADINTLKACPLMPYYDKTKPYVNSWFSASEGAGIRGYNKMVTPENIDRLVSEGGACIMYTHFAAGFYKDGRLNPQFQNSMEYLSRKNGWFVPVSVLLDYLAEKKGVTQLSSNQRLGMELRWLATKLKQGRGS